MAPPSRASDFARSDDGRGKSAEEVRAPFREAQLTSEDLSEIVEHPTLPVRVRVRALEELVRVAPTAREELARRLGASVHRELREALDDVADTPSSDRFTRTSAR